MAQAKGGRKLKRTAKHAGMYKAQFYRTARNKANRVARIARRKLEIPNKSLLPKANSTDTVID